MRKAAQMFRITRTIYILRDGSREYSDHEVRVKDLEEYRKSLRQPRYARIHFVYQTIPDDELDGENKEA